LENQPREKILAKVKPALEKDGGHGPNGCTTVVKNAAKWVAELLLGER